MFDRQDGYEVNKLRPRNKGDPPPLPPELVRIIEALAVAAARRDHAREASGEPKV